MQVRLYKFILICVLVITLVVVIKKIIFEAPICKNTSPCYVS